MVENPIKSFSILFANCLFVCKQTLKLFAFLQTMKNANNSQVYLEKGVKEYQKNLTGQSDCTPSFEDKYRNHDDIS